MDAGLVIRVPESEALVSRWRTEHDPSARDGMPAHVTVLFPFKPFEQITAADRAALAALFAAHEPFDLTFSEIGRFPDTLWLKPEPDAPFRALTRAVERAFPDYPIYSGAFDDVIPHLTVAQGSAAVLDEIEGALRRAFRPFRSRATTVTLFAKTGGWTAQGEFALGQKA
jgi:2'-5' RNA ligase